MAKEYTRITRLLGRIFQLKYWIDFDRLQKITLYLVRGTKTLFTIDTKGKKEHFTTMTKKFRLTEPKLQAQERALLWWGRVLCIFGVCIGGYSVYHLSHAAYRAWLISIVMMGVAFVLSFRYFFFAFQIQQKKLGCSFQEWVQIGLLRRKQ